MELDSNSLQTYDAVGQYIQQNFPKNIPICDLGAGRFEFLNILQDFGFNDLTGVTFEPKKIENIKNIANVDLSSDYSERINKKFDVLVSLDVIEHLINPFSFLTNIKDILSDDGVLVLTFPNIHSLRSRISFLVNGRFTGFFGPNFNNGHPLHDQHIWIPNKHLIEYFLTLLGMRIIEKEYIGGYFNSEIGGYTTMLIIKNQKTKLINNE